MTEKNNVVNLLRERIKAEKQRSAWDQGVTRYALELLDNLDDMIQGGYFQAEDINPTSLLERALLNGADSWSCYSWGGCSLIYNSDIADRLCNKTEWTRSRGGERRPNRNEEWLDVQARALHRAASRIRRHAKAIKF